MHGRPPPQIWGDRPPAPLSLRPWWHWHLNISVTSSDLCLIPSSSTMAHRQNSPRQNSPVKTAHPQNSPIKTARSNSLVKIAQGILKEPLRNKVLPKELGMTKKERTLTKVSIAVKQLAKFVSKCFNGIRINNKEGLKKYSSNNQDALCGPTLRSFF